MPTCPSPSAKEAANSRNANDPKALRNAINAKENIDLAKLAQLGNITVEELQSFIDSKTTPDMPGIDAMAEFLDVTLPEINVVDFFHSGYIPEAMVNFLAFLGWNPGTGREIMPLDELIASFDITRLTKTNSLFDRGKLLAFNTEHMRMVSPEKLLKYFKDYLKAVNSPMLEASDEILNKLLQLCAGARTLADVEHKCRFLFVSDDAIEFDDKAVKKVLMKEDGLAILPILREKLIALEQFTAANIENMLRSLAEEKQLGLGKVAQPLRVAITGTHYQSAHLRLRRTARKTKNIKQNRQDSEKIRFSYLIKRNFTNAIISYRLNRNRYR